MDIGRLAIAGRLFCKDSGVSINGFGDASLKYSQQDFEMSVQSPYLQVR
jgi:hypothetical protein